MHPDILKYIYNYPEKFQTLDLTEAYFGLYSVASITVSEFTDFLLNQGFNPLHYMKEVPSRFLDESSYDKEDTFIVPSNIKVINRNAFKGSLFKRIIITEGCEVIQGLAFKEMPNLEELYFPKSLKEFGLIVCIKCKALKKIHYPGTWEEFQSIQNASKEDYFDWYKTDVGRIGDKCILICKDQTIELGIPE
jgi:hypothetical protein